MCKSVSVLLLALLVCSACRASVAAAVEAVPLPPQVPAHTSNGAVNLTDVWLHSGGGRLYWNTLVTPRQIALEGARFVDPASVPELALTPPTAKKPPVRHSSRKVKVAKAAPHAPLSQAPKGVGKTSLQAPASQSSAIPPMGSAVPVPAKSGSTGAAPAPSGGAAPAPSSDAMPYSSVAPSPVGGIGSGVSSNAAAGVPAPPTFSADDVLPRANARP